MESPSLIAKRFFIVTFGILFLFAVVGMILSIPNMATRHSGKIADAEKVLRPGQVYECVTPPIKINNDEGWDWCAIVKVENKYFGLKFGSQPSLKGVVAEQEGTIVFLRITNPDGITISNPFSAD